MTPHDRTSSALPTVADLRYISRDILPHRSADWAVTRAHPGRNRSGGSLRRFSYGALVCLRATIHRDPGRLSGDCSEKDSVQAHSSIGKPAITRTTAPGDAMRRHILRTSAHAGAAFKCAVWIAKYAAISRSAQRGRRASEGRRKSLRHLALPSLARSSGWYGVPASTGRFWGGLSLACLHTAQYSRTPAPRSKYAQYGLRGMQPPAHAHRGQTSNIPAGAEEPEKRPRRKCSQMRPGKAGRRSAPRLITRRSRSPLRKGPRTTDN